MTTMTAGDTKRDFLLIATGAVGAAGVASAIWPFVATMGPDAFYKGRIANAIVDAVAASPRNAASLTLRDLKAFRPLKRSPVCAVYRKHRVCGMAPPSSGGIASIQILKMLERFPLGDMKPSSAAALHLFVEAQRLAFADRAAFLADPAYVPVPVVGLLNPRYLARRSALIAPQLAMPADNVFPGEPKGASRVLQRLRIPDHSRPSTAHVSVIDRKGNAIAMTTTVEGPFGSHLMAAGFILNNQLTDFAFEPRKDNRYLANAPKGGKRPLSSMTPTLVFSPDGRLFAVIGSPGGWRIIPYVTKTLLGLIDWRLGMAEAIGLPNVTSRSQMVELEAGTGLEQVAAELQAMGHQVKFMDQTSGLNGIRITPGGFDAAADLRREGSVAGD
jgi:gamma-glutamyltranspeptidase/glutathione hydrolase